MEGNNERLQIRDQLLFVLLTCRHNQHAVQIDIRDVLPLSFFSCLGESDGLRLAASIYVYIEMIFQQSELNGATAGTGQEGGAQWLDDVPPCSPGNTVHQVEIQPILSCTLVPRSYKGTL